MVQVFPPSMLSCHWSVSGAVPAATTLKSALPPAATVWLAGWVAMVGASGRAGSTTRVIALLVASGFVPLLTTH